MPYLHYLCLTNYEKKQNFHRTENMQCILMLRVTCIENLVQFEVTIFRQLSSDRP